MVDGQTQAQTNYIEIVGLKKDVEFLKESERNDRAEIAELKKELDELKESYSNLVAKGTGMMAAVIALGATVAWFIDLFKAWKR